MIAYDLDLPCSRTSRPKFSSHSITLVEQAQTTPRGVDRRRSPQPRMGVLEENSVAGEPRNRNGKLLQIILAVSRSWIASLDAPNLRQLKQRIVLRCNLQPFTLRDAIEYILSRLERAGVTRTVDLFRRVVGGASSARPEGIPRVINALCDQSAANGRAGAKDLHGRNARRSLQDMRLGGPAAAACGSRRRRRILRERTPY